MRNSALVLVLLSSLAQGCADEAPDATPEGALGELIDALEESRYDDERRADVYALLDEGSRQELAARAARAEALGRSGLEPWEMIAIGRARLAFEPTQMSARVDGDRAVVVAQGRGGAPRGGPGGPGAGGLARGSLRRGARPRVERRRGSDGAGDARRA